MTTLDPASRELLQAIAAMLDAQPKPQTAEQVGDYWQRMSDRAAIVRTAIGILLEHQQDQTDRARYFARELRLIAAHPGRPPSDAQPPLLTRPHDWPPDSQ